MKKWLAMICAVAMVFALVGCGTKDTPETVVSAFCQQMKAFDPEAMSAYVKDGETIGTETTGEDVPEKIVELMKEKAGEMTYTVAETTIEGDQGKVRVDFRYPDLSSTVTSVLGEYMTQAFGLAIAGASEEELSHLLETIFVEQIGKAEPATAETSVEFHCIKTEDGWKMEAVPDEVMNIMLSNTVSALEEISGSAEEKEEDLVSHDVALGEEIQLATMKATVTGCTEETTIHSDWNEVTAKEGTKYVVFTVTFENTTKEPFVVSAGDFPLYDGLERSYSCDDEAMFGVEDAMQYRELAPNMPETGVIIYNVPADSQNYYLAMRKAETSDVYHFFGA